MPTLYRKYRPQSFVDLIGQQHIIKTLTNEIAMGKTAQAYLFSGPRGTGKTTVARLLAKAINCANRLGGSFEPCNECSSCQEISAGHNIDVMEIDAASHTQVDNVRESIIENAQFKPTKSKFKIFIIDEVHMLSNSSFNALLKTLEEPPKHVVFILATTELHKILPTIVSRCERFAFQKILYEEMKDRLNKISHEENIKVDKEVVDRIINKSDGCVRDAESLLGQLFSLNLKSISADEAQLVLPTTDVSSVIDFAQLLVTGNCTDSFMLLKGLAENGVNWDQFAYDLIEILRIIMIAQAGQVQMNVDYDENTVKQIKKLVAQISPEKLVKLIDRTLERKREIKTSPLPQLPLELLAVEFSGENSKFDEKIIISDRQPETKFVKQTAQTYNEITEEIISDSKSTSEPNDSHSFTQSIKSAISAITGKHEIKTSLSDIESKWPELIKLMDESHHSLTFSLKLCTLKEISADGLMISIPYELHRDKLEDRKNKKTIEDCLSQLCGERISFFCDLASAPAPKPAQIEPAVDIDNLAAEFGGEVVAK